MSFAALALRARAANDTTRAQINNIPSKSHFIVLFTNRLLKRSEKCGYTNFYFEFLSFNVSFDGRVVKALGARQSAFVIFVTKVYQLTLIKNHVENKVYRLVDTGHQHAHTCVFLHCPLAERLICRTPCLVLADNYLVIVSLSFTFVDI